VNNFGKYLLLVILLSQVQMAFGYIQNQTRSGVPLHWSSQNSRIDIFVNPQNDQGLAEETVQSIATNSINEWNGLSGISLRSQTTSRKGQDNLNELYFTADPSMFGSGVIGMTMVSFSERTGEILSADILINDNIIFSTNETDPNFLGNVISHESGHFIGLGHGQVAGSTMFYTQARGQNKLSDDDKAGIYSTYPNGNANIGSLSGRIIGGKKLVSVFGAHVQAISVKSGNVMGATISELDGKFKIAGLPIDDQYLIYTSPIKQLGIPTNYANVRSDFCEGSTKYRGSFFQSCRSSSEGFPEAVKLNSSLVNIGNISIRCGLDAPTKYLQNKNLPANDFDINEYTGPGLGASFVGFFSAKEVSQPDVKDYFRINFSNIENWNSYSSSDLFVELKVKNQPFFSAYKANVNITRIVSNVDITPIRPNYSQDSDGWINVDTITRVPINKAVLSDNDFEIKITPDFSYTPSGIPVDFGRSDIFPGHSLMQEDQLFYLVIATIVKHNDDGTFTQVSSKNDSLSDNTMCPDGVNTYALSSFTASGGYLNSDRKQVAACGTVVDNGDGAGGGGPGGFMIGILLCFIISYALSRYSKMA
jgi:hypothetical protein